MEDQVVHAEHDGVQVVSVTGDVDHGSVEVISTALAARLAKRPVGVVLDLDGVEFFGSLGITAMLEALESATRLGVGFAVAANCRPVLRTLQVTGTAEVLRVRRTLREAVDLARSGRGGTPSAGLGPTALQVDAREALVGD